MRPVSFDCILSENSRGGDALALSLHCAHKWKSLLLLGMREGVTMPLEVEEDRGPPFAKSGEASRVTTSSLALFHSVPQEFTS